MAASMVSLTAEHSAASMVERKVERMAVWMAAKKGDARVARWVEKMVES